MTASSGVSSLTHSQTAPPEPNELPFEADGQAYLGYPSRGYSQEIYAESTSGPPEHLNGASPEMHLAVALPSDGTEVEPQNNPNPDPPTPTLTLTLTKTL